MTDDAKRGVVERDIIDDLLRINENSVTALLEMKTQLEFVRQFIDRLGVSIPEITHKIEGVSRTLEDFDEQISKISSNLASLTESAKNYEITSGGVKVRDLGDNINKLLGAVSALTSADVKFKNATVIIGTAIGLLVAAASVIALMWK